MRLMPFTFARAVRAPRRRKAWPTLTLAALAVASAAATAQAAGLPDGRAWEQVSPVDKNGGDLATFFGQPQAGVAVSADGGRVAFMGSTPFADAPSGLIALYYRAERGPGGWTTHSISKPLPSASNVLDAEIPNVFTSDLGAAIFTTPFPYDAGDADADPPNFVPTGHYDVYAFGAGDTTWISQGGPTTPNSLVDAMYAGASDDLSHVVFETPEALTPDAQGLTSGNYLYERTGGQTTLLDVDDNGALLDPNGAVLGSGQGFGGGGPSNTSGGTTRNAISGDGTKAFFMTPPSGVSQVYVRDTAAGRTVHVSAPAPGVVDPNGTQPATYQGAAADGSLVVFTTAQQLTADDTDTSPDAYAYDTTNDTLVRVSRGQSGIADANVDGVVLVSDDGSTVYFVAEHQLVGGKGTDGQPNLYRYDTGSGDTTFIATLSPGDAGGLWSGNDTTRQAFATADGAVLAFTSQASVTPYDAQGHREAYLYRRSGDTLECASCRPDGTPPSGDAEFGLGPLGPNSFFQFGFPVPLTADGARLFFETTDSLVPEDANGGAPGSFAVPGSLDVYEYAGGQVGLISDGRSTDGSLLAGVSPSGDDVFFFTRSALVPQDVDGGGLDIYDARVGGGFPPPPGTTDCEGEGCRPGPSQAPFLPVPTTTAAREGTPPIVRATFTVRSIGAAAAARAVRTGRLTLSVRVTAPGSVVARATGPIGGRTRSLGSARHRFTRAGTARLTLRLSTAARAYLRRHARLRVRIDVTYSHGGLRRRATVTLRRNGR